MVFCSNNPQLWVTCIMHRNWTTRVLASERKNVIYIRNILLLITAEHLHLICSSILKSSRTAFQIMTFSSKFFLCWLWSALQSLSKYENHIILDDTGTSEYIQGEKVRFEDDDEHELCPVKNVSAVKREELSMHVCGMLNRGMCQYDGGFITGKWMYFIRI